MEALHNIHICSDETATQILVRALSIREQLGMGGGSMDDSKALDVEAGHQQTVVTVLGINP